MTCPVRGLRARVGRSATSPADGQPSVALTPIIDFDDKLIPMFLVSYSSLFPDALAGWSTGDTGVCCNPSGCGGRQRNGSC